MAFSRPSLADLIARAASDIEAELPGTDARLRRSNLGAISRMHAAAMQGLYGYLDYISRQILVDQADGDFLVRWATLWAIVRKSASKASGQGSSTGSDGVVVPIGVVLQRADGVLYETTTEKTVASGVVTLDLRASDAGAAGNCSSGTKLAVVEPVAGLSTTVTVGVTGCTGGRDQESDDELRSRVIARMQSPPAGGAAADYMRWAREVAGVTRAWCYPLEDGPGTVSVRFVRDGDVSIIPNAGQVAEVQAYINPKRPVTATLTVKAPTLLTQAFNISVTPDNTSVRTAVQAELADLLQRESSPGGRIFISRIREAVSSGAGESDSTVVSPTADIVPATGQIVTLGTITWS
jgi:uncharacterized phage protein gp47/JayE